MALRRAGSSHFPARLRCCIRPTGTETAIFYVYLLECIGDPTRRYVGQTVDLRRRLAEHNAGRSPHTAKFRPWRLAGYVAFTTLEQAVRFERYLKSGSGHAFAKRHLWPPLDRAHTSP